MILPVKLLHRTTGECIAADLRLADTVWSRFRGLMGRKALGQGEGLWIRPCNGVHSFWMRFPIDIVFLDRDLKVVKLVENLRPFRLTIPVSNARSVIELAGGSIGQFGICKGDPLRVER